MPEELDPKQYRLVGRAHLRRKGFAEDGTTPRFLITLVAYVLDEPGIMALEGETGTPAEFPNECIADIDASFTPLRKWKSPEYLKGMRADQIVTSVEFAHPEQYEE